MNTAYDLAYPRRMDDDEVSEIQWDAFLLFHDDLCRDQPLVEAQHMTDFLMQLKRVSGPTRSRANLPGLPTIARIEFDAYRAYQEWLFERVYLPRAGR